MSDGPPQIAIVDYGMGNRRSVEKALARVGAHPLITRKPDELRAADGLLLPGVGAFPAAMKVIRAMHLDGLIGEIVDAGTPLFGSCMGMQLLFESSEEHGGAEGLGLLAGEVRRLPVAPPTKLPHIGWSAVEPTRDDPLVAGLPDPFFLYHVHTYAPVPADEEVVLGWADYDGVRFAGLVGSGHVFGAQSHPEKSSSHGLALLSNFVGLCAARLAAAR